MKFFPLLSLTFLIFYLSSAIAQEPDAFTDCLSNSDADDYALWSVHLIEDCAPVQALVDHSSVFLASLGQAEDELLMPARLAVLQSVSSLMNNVFTQNPGANRPSMEAFSSALRCDMYRLDQSFYRECTGSTRQGNALQRAKWSTRDVQGTVYHQTFLDPVRAKAPECLSSKPDIDSECHRLMLEEFVPILELLNLMRQIVVPAINDGIESAVAVKYSENQLRWAGYLSETGFQYPHELVFNRKRHGGFSEIAQGREAPRGRWILMHPTAGIYHSGKLPDGNQTALLGIVKIIGGKRWRYGPDNKPDRMVGLSLTATIADIAGIDDLGFGVLAEYKSIALGVSNHGDENLLVFNVAIDELLRSRARTLDKWLPILGF